MYVHKYVHAYIMCMYKYMPVCIIIYLLCIYTSSVCETGLQKATGLGHMQAQIAIYRLFINMSNLHCTTHNFMYMLFTDYKGYLYTCT